MTSPSQSPEGRSGSPSEQGRQPSDDGEPPPELVSQRVRTAIALTITTVWAVGIVFDGLSPMFELSPFVHAAMLGLAASVFGSNFVKGLRQ